MAATAEAPAAEVAAPTTTTKQQQAPSSSSSKQAEEPVLVVSSLASVYPDGDFFFLKKETAFRFLPFGTGLARRLLFCFLWREHHPDVSYSMQRQKGAIKSAATPPPLLRWKEELECRRRSPASQKQESNSHARFSLSLLQTPTPFQTRPQRSSAMQRSGPRSWTRSRASPRSLRGRPVSFFLIVLMGLARSSSPNRLIGASKPMTASTRSVYTLFEDSIPPFHQRDGVYKDERSCRKQKKTKRTTQRATAQSSPSFEPSKEKKRQLTFFFFFSPSTSFSSSL